MAEKYFLKYQAQQDKPPYTLPEELKKQLLELEGLKILSNYERGSSQPVVIVEIEKDKVEQVKSLEGVVKLFENVQLRHFSSK